MSVGIIGISPPSGVLICIEGATLIVGRIIILLVDVAGVGAGIQHGNFLDDGGDAGIHAEFDLRPFRTSPLGVDDDDTVGAARPVNSRRRGVFQHFHRFDVVRIDETERVGGLLRGDGRIGGCAAGFERDTVHNIQRLGTGGEGVGAAHQDAHAAARGAVALLHDHAGDFALEAMGDIEGSALHQVFRFDLADGSGQVAFLDRTIADDNGFIQVSGLFFQRNVDDGLCAHADGVGHITQQGEYKHVRIAHTGNFVFTVEVGRGELAAVALYLDNNSGERPVFGGGCHDTLDRPGLRSRCEADKQQRNASQQFSFHNGFLQVI